tara:strand:- start:4811 stop:5236 length:426 start_codon:yes stop_codon:yes gene_type:complete
MSVDTSYLSDFYLQTFGEDQKYKEEILNNTPTVFFRPDDRTSFEHPMYWHCDKDGLWYIGLIATYGSHKKQKPPVFTGPRAPVRVLSCVAKPVRDIAQEELRNAYKDIDTYTAVCDWLNAKYPEVHIIRDSIVTVYVIEYE